MRESSEHGEECLSLLIDRFCVGRVDEYNDDGVSRRLSTTCFDAGDLDLHDGQTNAAPGPTHALHLRT